MINWFNMPAEGLSNGGQFEIKELTATENKTYEKDGEVYNKVTVNVSGGGGSSDFSKVNVTLKVNEGNNAHFNIFFANPETGDVNGFYVFTEDNVRYITNDAKEIFIGQNDGEITFEAYHYLNNPIYAVWLEAESVDDYTITGDAETSTFTDQGYTFYAVTISGDCTVSVEGSVV